MPILNVIENLRHLLVFEKHKATLLPLFIIFKQAETLHTNLVITLSNQVIEFLDHEFRFQRLLLISHLPKHTEQPLSVSLFSYTNQWNLTLHYRAICHS